MIDNSLIFFFLYLRATFRIFSAAIFPSAKQTGHKRGQHTWCSFLLNPTGGLLVDMDMASRLRVEIHSNCGQHLLLSNTYLTYHTTNGLCALTNITTQMNLVRASVVVYSSHNHEMNLVRALEVVYSSDGH